MPDEYDTTEAFWAPCDECHAVKPVKWFGPPPARVLLCKPCRERLAHAPDEFTEPGPLVVAALFLFLAGLGVFLGCVVHFANQ